MRSFSNSEVANPVANPIANAAKTTTRIKRHGFGGSDSSGIKIQMKLI
jgi:hypothetical protein